MMRILTVNRKRRRFMQTRVAIVLLIAVALLVIDRAPNMVGAKSLTTESAVRSQIATVPMLQGTFQTINNGPGNQTNPQIDGNVVSYTNDDFQGSSTIHYRDFSTGMDNIAPGNALDLLSDVSGSRIAFTQVEAAGENVVVFDTVSQTRTVIPRAHAADPSISGDLVAFEDWGFVADQSEIGIYNLSTGALTRLTNDTSFDRRVDVSPTGNALVWEKCQTDGLGCDVFAALQTSPGVFTTTPISQSAGEDRQPHTNGDLVVYVSNKSGENDIYYRPLLGGAETQLSLPGNQLDPTISGDLIAFESQVQAGTEYDIFVYDISAGELFQVTNTPGNETLSEVDASNGIGHIVYAIPGFGDFDVYAFTFQVPSSSPNQINDLIALVKSFNLPAGTANSLITKLQDAQAAIDASDTATACDSLTAFINACQGQSGKKLTADQANQLINSATQIKTTLGCQ